MTRAPRRLLAVLVAAFSLLVLSPVVLDSAQAVVTSGAHASSETWLPAATADQGLAVFGGHLLARGHRSIPPALRSMGWMHIGDPDATSGFVVDAYQGSARAASKAFGVTYADGRQVLLVHPLAAGESYHNSFVTVSPDGRWLVAGEWGTENRLLVFARPANAGTGPVQTLPLAGVVALAQPVRNVQGCDFSSATRLLCSTNDTTTALFPVARQLLSLRLSHALDGTPVRATVGLVGSVPAQDVCAGASGEVEGIDVTVGVVRVAVNSPCADVTEVFAYPRDATWRRAGDIDVHTAWSGAPPLVDVPVRRPLPGGLRLDT